MKLRLGRVKVPGRYVEFGGLRESVQTIRAGLVGLDRGVGCILYNDLGFIIRTEFMVILSQSIACYG